MHLPALTSYLRGLSENNDKAWFVMNKPAYDILRPEFMALVGEVVAGLGKHDRKIADVDPRKALFRIYRDVRFSNDKTPYKTYFSASIAEDGAKKSGPMYYLSIDANANLHLGAGCYLPEKDVLGILRRRVVADHASLARVLKNRRLVATFGAMSTEDRLARLPKGYDAAAPGIEKYGELLRLKSYVLQKNVDLTAVSGVALADTIVDALRAAAPLNDWLRSALRTPALQAVDGSAARFSPTRTKRATKSPTS